MTLFILLPFSIHSTLLRTGKKVEPRLPRQTWPANACPLAIAIAQAISGRDAVRLWRAGKKVAPVQEFIPQRGTPPACA